MEGQRNPEIQRVLAALNSFSQQQQQQQQDESSSSTYINISSNNQAPFEVNSTSITTSGIPGLGLLPQSATYHSPGPSPAINQKQSYDPRQIQHWSRMSTPQPPADALRSKTSTPKYDVPDASAITTWPGALKHVTRYLAPNVRISDKIKHLINEQHKHEREWWAGREAIVARHQGTSGSSEQVSAILRSLGAKVAQQSASLPREQTPEQKRMNQDELKKYDEKVYKALCAMTADFDRQLREMGVPFFAIKYELVVLKDGPERIPGEHKVKLDKGELRELQKRMCQTLEDLFGD